MALHSSIAEALRLTRAGTLGDATRLIQAALAGGPPVVAPITGTVIDLLPEKIAPAPGGVSERSYTGDAGTLGYRLYRPAGAAAGMPLVVMLHGCTQSPEDFARGTGMDRLADELSFLVAYPRQTASANAQKCWNWFDPRHQRRDGGEPALVAGIVREVLARERVDPRRVYVAGLSAGGAAAAVMAARYPDLFAAVGIHSGLACGAARDLPSALSAMQRGGGVSREALCFVPTISFHGDRDMTVGEVNAGEIMALAAAAHGAPLEIARDTGTSAGGRRYTRVTSRDGTGRPLLEQWTLHGGGHAWSGGDAAGSYTDPTGPDASREMLRFFLGHELASG